MRLLPRLTLVALALALPGITSGQPPQTKAVSFNEILAQVKGGTSPADILAGCDTVFTLTDGQRAELVKAKAPASLVDALQMKRMKVGDVTDFVVILDCSGSMTDKIDKTQTKMDAAKRVVGDLFDAIPDGRNLAFIVYGHDAALECKAVKVVRPLGPVTAAARKELRAELNKLKPVGHTPIANSLKVAGDVLAKGEGMSQIVVITDGEETCHGDPAAEAEALTTRLKNLRAVEVIGLGMTKEEKAKVVDIARRGRGKFYDADTAAELRKAVAKAADAPAVEKPKDEPKVAKKEEPKPTKADDKPAKSTEVAEFTSKLVHKIEGHTDTVCGIAFSPDGKLLASASKDKTVRIWDVKTGERVARIDFQEEAWSVAFAPDSKQLVVGGHGGKLAIFDPTTGEQQKKFTASDATAHLIRWSPDGKLIGLVIYNAKHVNILDADTGKAVSALKGHGRWITNFAFSPDSKLAATASADATIRVWDPKTGKEKDSFKRDGTTQALTFCADGKTLITGGNDGTVIRWDIAKGNVIKPVTEMPKAEDNGVIAVGELPNGTVWTFDKGNRQGLIEPTDGKVLARQPKPTSGVRNTNEYANGIFALSPDGKHTAFVTGSQVIITDCSATFNGAK